MTEIRRPAEPAQGNDPMRLGPESAETAEVHADQDHPETNAVEEETPVLDVHMPHETHTWKDFWIHLGTITAGLLIAISLEQSVEKLHHLQQRHELEAALRAEVEVNKDRAEIDLARYDEDMTWLLGLHKDIGRMLATGGKANLPYRELHYRPMYLHGAPYKDTSVALMTAVWDTANADNRLALLPDDVVHAYSLLYHLRGEHFEVYRLLAHDALARQAAFELMFADIATPRTPVLARMSATDLKQYDALVAQSFTADRQAKVWLRFVYGSNEAIRQGRYDFASIQRSTDEAQAAFTDDYGRMAQEIAAEDAARDGAAGRPVKESK
jgi:hypothetical protein